MKEERELENELVSFKLSTLADILIYTGMCFGFITSLLWGIILCKDILSIFISVCAGILLGGLLEGFLFAIILEIYKRIKK